MSDQREILVAIDDDAATLELIKEALASLNLEVLTFTSPSEGLDAIIQNEAAIAVLDLVLPGQDGMDLLQSVVRQSPATEVLLLTGHYSTESALEAIQKGACDYMETFGGSEGKPIIVSPAE